MDFRKLKSPRLASYLSDYAEPEIAAIAGIEKIWDVAVVLPLMGEGRAIKGLLDSLQASAAAQGVDCLVIAVVNARFDSPEIYHQKNSELLGDWKKGNADHGTVAFGDRLDLLWIDRASEGVRFPSGQGVGLARKMGSDVAVALYACGKLNDAWIRTTDADATVTLDYLAPIPSELSHRRGIAPQRVTAACYDYLHDFFDESPLEAEALALYEIYLRYYVLGLESAGSPYAFPTIGSTIVFSAEAYAEVRGFPKREAAEDFYFLNKLAQIGSVATLPEASVKLAQRISRRVPFGTGRATIDISQSLREGSPYTMYDPRPFASLRHVIACAESVGRHRNLKGFEDELRELVPEEAETVIKALVPLRFNLALLQALETRPTEASFIRHFHTWFDGLRTLKFLHQMRDLDYPKLPYREALEKASFIPLDKALIKEGSPRQILEALRLNA